MKKIILYGIITLVIGAASIYLALPTLNYGYYGLPLIIFLISGLLYVLDFSSTKKGHFKKINPIVTLVFWGSLIFILLVPAISSLTIIKHSKYKELIGEVKVGEDFTNHVSPISTEEIRIVDESMAYRLGDKVIGTIPSLGSQIKLGDFNIQKVHNKLYWIAPLLHSGFFK